MAATRNVEELPRWAVELLDAARVGHLGLIDDHGRPRVLPVTFALVAGEAWSAVDDKPKRRPGERLARVRWLRARPAATLTVDRYEDDWSALAWVQLVGTVAVLDRDDHGDALAALADRYPQYRKRPPRGPLLRLTPEHVVCWSAAG